MYALSETLLKQQNFCYNQLESFNNFIKSETGLKNIILKMFKIQNIIGIEETVLVKDGKTHTIRSIGLNVSFKNVEIKPFDATTEEIEYFINSGGQQKKQKLIV